MGGRGPHGGESVGGTAKALLGRLRFGRGEYEEAVPWWADLDPARRGAWGLDEPLRGDTSWPGCWRWATAATSRRRSVPRRGQARAARPAPGPLLTLALVKAGQEKLFSANGQATEAVEQVTS